MVIRRGVLAALAEGIAAGSSEAARAAIRHTEWLLRGRARRRLDKALVYARFATVPAATPDAEHERYLQRVAALEVAGIVGFDALDRAQVDERYAALPRVRPLAIPVAAIASVLAMLGVVAGIAWFVWLREVDPEIEAVAAATPVVKVRQRAAPATGAFVSGGVPLRDPDLEKLFVGDFVDYILEVDRERAGKVRSEDRIQHSAALTAAAAIAKYGPKVTGAWRDLLATLDRWPQASLTALDDLGQEVADKARVMSEQLAGAGIGYYLEGIVRTSTERQSALVYTYLVDEVSFVVAGGESRRVLSVRRVDHLNRSWAVLGLHSEDLGDPIVLLDKIDEHVVGTLLPVLAPEAHYPLGDPAVETEAGRAVRAELVALSGDPAAATAIGTLLADRAVIIAGWREHLKSQSRTLSRLESLYIPEELLASLARNKRVAEPGIARVREIDRKIAGLAAEGIVANLTDAVASAVRRHEARHGIDADRHPALRYPAALEAYVGFELDDDGKPRRRVERARLELAAYLAEIANDPTTTHTTYSHVTRWVFDKNAGGAEYYAALVIVEGLGRHLVTGAEAKALEVGPVTNRATLYPHVRLAFAATGPQLRAAADALWRELYAEPPLPIVDR
ncbi:MAG: hypothetical protein ABI867_09865 [Kofleriaceae bacterium]